MTAREAARIIYCAEVMILNGEQKQFEDAMIVALDALREMDKQEKNKGCAWCNAEYTIIDDEFGLPIHPNSIKFCWHCGRKLREEHHAE